MRLSSVADVQPPCPWSSKPSTGPTVCFSEPPKAPRPPQQQAAWSVPYDAIRWPCSRSADTTWATTSPIGSTCANTFEDYRESFTSTGSEKTPKANSYGLAFAKTSESSNGSSNDAKEKFPATKPPSDGLLTGKTSASMASMALTSRSSTQPWSFAQRTSWPKSPAKTSSS